MSQPDETSQVSARRSIHEWDEADRPRERFATHGGNALSKAELLAILVGSGNADEDAVQLMQRVLADHNNSLRELGRLSIDQLCRYKGIGPAKAITILAACELGQRRGREEAEIRTFDSSQRIYEYFRSFLADRNVEEAHLLLLNQRLRLIRSIMLGRGGLSNTAIDLRIALREALVHNALHIALCHNHPSGDPTPSRADDQLTESLRQACNTMQIRLIDHIVLGENCYYSYADHGKL